MLLSDKAFLNFKAKKALLQKRTGTWYDLERIKGQEHIDMLNIYLYLQNNRTATVKKNYRTEKENKSTITVVEATVPSPQSLLWQTDKKWKSLTTSINKV